MLAYSCSAYSDTYVHLLGKHHKEIHFSFKKLMRAWPACSPSSLGAGAFLSAIHRGLMIRVVEPGEQIITAGRSCS